MGKAKLTLLNAVKAQCWECCGFYSDGREDCGNTRCPLYKWMPYKDKKKEPDLWWLKFNPRRKGKVTWEESKPNISEEQIEATKKRFAAYRKQNSSDG